LLCLVPLLLLCLPLACVLLHCHLQVHVLKTPFQDIFLLSNTA
jgi:hypothetical protein